MSSPGACTLARHCGIPTSPGSRAAPCADTRARRTYQQISPETLPPELFSNNTLMDYALGSVPSGPAAYVFVLDGCLSRAEMAAMVRGVQHALSMVPDGALISLLTFSSHVVVHELGPGLRPRSWCLRGEPALEAHDLLALLGLRGGSRASANGTLTAAGTSGERCWWDPGCISWLARRVALQGCHRTARSCGEVPGTCDRVRQRRPGHPR